MSHAAHRYAENGWPVFPCAPGTKLPLTEHGFLDATAGHAQIERWWRAHPDANVAIATGAPGPDVLDVDVHKDGSGFPGWNKLKAAGLVPEPKAIVKTPSGGLHAYFEGTSQRNGHLPDQHIDFRSQGGYVVAPPSEVDRRPYVVVRHQPSAETFDWTAAREHLSPSPEPRRPAPDAQPPRTVAHLVPWLSAQHEGNRNAGLFWSAARAVEAGDHATLDQLAKVAADLGLGAREIDATVRSAQRAAAPQAHNGASPRPFEPEREREAEAG